MKEEKINFYEKIISIILIIAIILPCFPISVLATEVKAVSQSLEVDETSKFKQSLITSTNEITEGNNVTISIQISDTSELEESPNLYTAKISYDTSILKYQSAKGSNGWNLRLFDYVTNVSEVSEPMESMQETTKEASIILEKNDSEMLVDGTIIYITFIVLKSPAEEEADPGTQISLSDGKLIVYDETEDEHLNMQLDDITGKTEYTSENTELKIGSSSEQMWTINYNANEGEEATIPASQTTKTGNNIIVSEEIPTREGAEFSGWAKDADADDIQYNVGGEVKYESVSSEMQDSNSLTLYAIWAKQEYKIVYFYNGGHKDDSENNVETKVKVYGEDYTIEDGPTREGYIFDGWYDIANMKKYEAQAKYQAEMELYLVAQWKPASYTVTLDAQDGTIPEEYAGNGYEEDVQKENGQTKIKVTYNDTYAKGEGTLPIPTKDKYTFLGWYTEQGEGNGVRIDEDSICTKTAEHTLYAHWKANEIIYWDIYYNVDGTVTKETKEDKETINLKEEQQKTGYKFSGWKRSNGNVVEANSTHTVTGTEVFTAEWQANTHTVTFNVNQGNDLTSEQKTKEATYDKPYGELPTPTRSGYIFDGWYTEQEADNGTLINSYTIFQTDSDQELYAHWKEDDSGVEKYTVQYEIDGIINPADNVEVVKNEEMENSINLKSDVTKKGYNFKGWKLDGSQDPEKTIYTPGEQYTVTSNVKFIAVFEVKTVTITFELSEGQFVNEEQASIQRQFGQRYSDGGSLPVPVRDGYTFTGWYTTEGEKIIDSNFVNFEDDFILSAKWTVNTFSIIFDTNHGEPSIINAKEKALDEDVELPNPTRKGYKFIGWLSSADGIKYVEKYNKNQSTVLTAQWEEEKYTITLELNGGKLQNDDPIDKSLAYGTEYELPIPIKEGYMFRGWYDSNNIQLGTKMNITKDQVITAKWITEIYKITYDVNEGTGVFYSQQRTIDSSDITIWNQEPTRDGYKFTGWLSSSDGIIYKTDGNNKYTKLASTTFTAQYEKLQYTIQYRPNSTGVHGNIENTIKDYNQSVALSEGAEYTKAGYRFMGWSIDPDDDYESPEYVGGESYSENKDVTLYALWMDQTDIVNENKIRIKYNMQGGTPQISTQIGSKENAYETLSSKIPEKYGYDFMGWTSSPEAAEAEYSAQGRYTGKEDITLYAVWKEHLYNIEYNLNGGTAGENTYNTQQKEHNGNSVYLYGTRPIRENYVFSGWGATETSTQPIYLAGDVYWENRDRVLYAIWTPVSYSIQYDTQGAKEVINTQYKTCEDTEFKLSDVTPTKVGYTFDYWQDSEENQYAPGDIYAENKNIVLTGEYTANEYTVTFNVDDDVEIEKTNMTVEYNKEYGELPTPIKENNEFKGWYTSDNKLVTDKTIFKQTENQELYAKWDSTLYHVYYDANRGTGAPSTQTRTKNGDEIIISGPGNMTKGGHNFVRWEDADGNVYNQGDTYSKDEDLTLYAIWDSQSYKVTYDANGGTGAPEPYWKEYDENYVLSTGNISKEGFTFKGWGLTTSTVAKDAISEYYGNADVTVYAIWEENFKEIQYDVLRGENKPENQTKYYTRELTITEQIPEKTGYNFLGWSTEPYGNTLQDVQYKPGSTLTSNDISILYAVWELQTCKLSYDANGGSGAPEEEVLNYGQKTQISTIIPTRTGYNFVGWGTKEGDVLDYTPGTDYTIYDEEVILHAIWKAQTFTVTYNANGGKNTPGMQTKVYGEDLLLSKIKPTRKGYDFIGWADEQTATNAQYNSGEDNGYYKEDKDITLYAIWQATDEALSYMYYCKVLPTDEDTDENTFDNFNSAKQYADAHKQDNIKVYDANGTLIYDPISTKEDLYLESEVFKGDGSVEEKNGEKINYVKVDTDTQLLEIINNCETNGTVEVYSTDGTKLANKDILGTGMKIKVTSSNSSESYEITVVVTGDLDSDGKISVSDLATITSHYTGATKLDGVYSIAADVDKDDTLTMSDLSFMVDYLSK